MERKYLEISWATLWRFFVFGILVYVIYISRSALGALFAAVVISLGIDPVVDYLEKKKINRFFATFIVFFVGLLVFAGVLYAVVPIIVTESVGFLRDFDAALSSVLGVRLPENVVRGISSNLSRILDFLSASNFSVTLALSQVFYKTVLFLAVLTASFYLTLENGGPERLIRVISPGRYEKSISQVFNKFKVKIKRWFGAQIMLSAAVGVIVSLGLWILGVRYPIVLGLLAAVFEIVPIIGPILAGLSAFLVAFSSSLSLGIYVLIFFLAVQQFENHVLLPVVMGKTMKIHPVIVIVALLAGGQIAGFVGVLLAVPSAVLGQEVLNYLAEQKDTKKGLGI